CRPARSSAIASLVARLPSLFGLQHQLGLPAGVERVLRQALLRRLAGETIERDLVGAEVELDRTVEIGAGGQVLAGGRVAGANVADRRAHARRCAPPAETDAAACGRRGAGVE